MSDKQQESNKWKDGLLKSSLPLEHLVIEKLARKHFYIAGEYPYIRPNEQNINTEFSIDLHAYTVSGFTQEGVSIWTRLNYLIECKYSYPGVKWVFSPHTIVHEEPMSIYSLDLGEDNVSFVHKDLSIDIPICTKGIELHSKDYDPHNISRGLSQLLYAMPNMILQEAKYSRSFRKFANHKVDKSLICLILVSTAELFVLKSGQSLESYHIAKSLDDVADKVDMLIVEQERGPGLEQYCEWLLAPALQEVDETLFKGAKKLIFNELIPKTFQVTIVNFEKIDDLLNITRNL